MNSQRQPGSDIEIDESALQEVPSIAKRIRNALYSLVLGIVLVQVFLFFRVFSGIAMSGEFGTGNSVVFYIYLYPLYFIVFLVASAVMGWIYGQKFIDWLFYKISEWKFW